LTLDKTDNKNTNKSLQAKQEKECCPQVIFFSFRRSALPTLQVLFFFRLFFAFLKFDFFFLFLGFIYFRGLDDWLKITSVTVDVGCLAGFSLY